MLRAVYSGSVFCSRYQVDGISLAEDFTSMLNWAVHDSGEFQNSSSAAVRMGQPADKQVASMFRKLSLECIPSSIGADLATQRAACQTNMRRWRRSWYLAAGWK